MVHSSWQCDTLSNNGVITHPALWDCLAINSIFITKLTLRSFLCVAMNIKESVSAHLRASRNHGRLRAEWQLQNLFRKLSSLCVAQVKSGSCRSLSAVIMCLSGLIDLSGEQSLQFSGNKIMLQFPTCCCRELSSAGIMASDSNPWWIKGNKVPEWQRSCTGWN